MASKQQLQTYRTIQNRIEANFERDLRAVWAKASKLGDVQAARVIEQALPVLIDKYGAQAGAIAADWFEALTGVDAVVPEPVKREAVEASARWAVGDRFTDMARGSANALVLEKLVSSGKRHVRQHARDTIDASAAASNGRVFYARMTVGDTCDFCVLLASRGPVYGSEITALRRDSDGKKYHDDCDCEAVPVTGSWVPDESMPRGYRWEGEDPGYDFEKLYDEEYKPFWKAPTKDRFDSLKDVLKRRREFVSEKE